tara:strand:- start:509 stop:784 length:276 start_codon:yes stop_codon:yes gene_type:complete
MAEHLDDDGREQGIDEVINMSLLIQKINKLIRNFKIPYVLIIDCRTYFLNTSFQIAKAGQVGLVLVLFFPSLYVFQLLQGLLTLLQGIELC